MIPPSNIYQYLLQRGLSPVHALGMLANIQGESGFNPLVNEAKPLVPGSRGGFGLFQHTGPRRVALEQAYGATPSWQDQVDFALQEPEGRAYAQSPLTDPAEATAAFTRDFQRPLDIPGAIAQRQGFLPDLARRIDGVDVRQAAALGGTSTDTDRTPTGDPMTGMMDPRMTQQAPLPPFPQMSPVEAPEEAAPSMLGLLATLAAGLAMGGGKGLSGALTGAGLAGNALRQQLVADNELWDLRQKRADAMRRRQRIGALDEYAQTLARTPGYEQAGAMMQIDPSLGAQYLGSMQEAQRDAALRQSQASALEAAGRSQEASLVRGGISPGSVSLQAPTAPTYGTTPHYEREGDQTYVVRYASDGTKLREPVQGTPWSMEQRLPDFRGEVSAAEAQGTAQGKKVEMDRQNAAVFDVLSPEIERSLPLATGSGVGTLRDTGMAFFGRSTEAGEHAARLKALAGRLIATIPRMEGPQSDRDVELYKQAAGQIGDSTVPTSVRMAAWDTIKEIAARQRSLGNPFFTRKSPVQEGIPVSSQGGWKIEKE